MLKQEIKKRFEKLLIDLQDFSINGYFKQTVQKFRPCIEPNEALGETQLPFYSDASHSHSSSKDHCVLCALSYTIRLYWMFCYEQDAEKGGAIRARLKHLESCAEHGSKGVKICGQKYPGYYLETV